ncbi:MAG: alcohol dehydrogenase catalytic domain-containing protein [Candidatus Thorarchaeota archaeon]|nr:alcohol dehydrogenase catalytic domain-containing protein [Candidatus Thorarchaeota archaeon]
MKSLIMTRDGLQIADTPTPPLMPGYVRIEVRSVGISRTDLKIWSGEVDVDLPLVLGHEIAGVVHESSDPEFKAGVPVTTESHLSCGSCFHCRNKKKHLCRAKKKLGFTVDGGMTEYLCVPSELIHKLPDPIDFLTGTFVEPLAVAIETYTRATVNPEEQVLVIGTGKTGLLVSQVFDAFGADVYLLGDNQWHLGVARQVGLGNILKRFEDWQKKILSATNGVGPSVVVEATGTHEGLQIALDIVRSDGTIALSGRSENNFNLDTRTIIDREISLFGTARGDFDMAIMMLQKGRIEVKRMISKQFSLEQGTQAFEAATKPENLKVNINI